MFVFVWECWPRVSSQEKGESTGKKRVNARMSYWVDHQVELVVKNLPTMQEIRDVGSIPGLGRFPGGGHGNPLQYSCLENSMDRGAWWARVHRFTKSQTQLSMQRWLLPIFCTCIRNLYNCLARKEKGNIYSLALVHSHSRAVQVLTGEGNGTPRQYSCLENPMDGGAW